MEEAARVAGMPDGGLDQIEPQPPRQIGDTPYRQTPTRVRLQRVTLEQLFTFLRTGSRQRERPGPSAPSHSSVRPPRRRSRRSLDRRGNADLFGVRSQVSSFRHVRHNHQRPRCPRNGRGIMLKTSASKIFRSLARFRGCRNQIQPRRRETDAKKCTRQNVNPPRLKWACNLLALFLLGLSSRDVRIEGLQPPPQLPKHDAKENAMKKNEIEMCSFASVFASFAPSRLYLGSGPPPCCASSAPSRSYSGR